MTQTGAAIGTWAYMAPERFNTDEIHPSSDIYALACVLYQCLTGQQPFPGDTLEQVAIGHIVTPPPRPSEISRTVPTALDAGDRHRPGQAARGPLPHRRRNGLRRKGSHHRSKSTRTSTADPTAHGAVRAGPPSSTDAAATTVGATTQQRTGAIRTRQSARPICTCHRLAAPTEASRAKPRHARRRSGVHRDAHRRRRCHRRRGVHCGATESSATHRPSAAPSGGEFTGNYTRRLRAGNRSRRQAGPECACDDQQLGRPLGMWRRRLRRDGGQHQRRRYGPAVEPDLRSVGRHLGRRRPRLGAVRRRSTRRALGGLHTATASRRHTRPAKPSGPPPNGACAAKRTVKFTRTGDPDPNKVPDPAVLPPRAVTPADALHGSYRQTTTFTNGSVVPRKGALRQHVLPSHRRSVHEPVPCGGRGRHADFRRRQVDAQRSRAPRRAPAAARRR